MSMNLGRGTDRSLWLLGMAGLFIPQNIGQSTSVPRVGTFHVASFWKECVNVDSVLMHRFLHIDEVVHRGLSQYQQDLGNQGLVNGTLEQFEHGHHLRLWYLWNLLKYEGRYHRTHASCAGSVVTTTGTADGTGHGFADLAEGTLRFHLRFAKWSSWRPTSWTKV